MEAEGRRQSASLLASRAPRSPRDGSGRADGGSFVNLTASVRLKTDVMAHRTTIVTRRGEAGQPARSCARRLRGSRPDWSSSPPWLWIVVLGPALVTIAQAFGGGRTAGFNAIKATSATTLLLHTGLVTAPAGANRQDLFRADRRFTTADVRV